MTTTPDRTAPDPYTTPLGTQPESPTPDQQSKQKRSYLRWLVPTLIGLIAFLLGVDVGATPDADTTTTAEPVPTATVTITATVPGAVPPQEQLDALTARESELDQRQTELDQRAADLDAREATLAEQEQAIEPPAPEPDAVGPEPENECHASYDPCVPVASDVDCEGGTGDGPAYTGRVRVIGPDEYDLDRDGNGVGCEQ